MNSLIDEGVVEKLDNCIMIQDKEALMMLAEHVLEYML